MRKNTRLSPPAQLQCSRSGVEVPGNKATRQYFYLLQPAHLEESPFLAVGFIAGSDLGRSFGVHLCCHGVLVYIFVGMEFWCTSLLPWY